MSEFVRCTPSQLPGLVRRRVKNVKERWKAAVESMPVAAVPIIRRRAPRAFGDLSNSVHGEPGKAVVSAPHAGAVEQGSMPHTPNFEALLAWVKLRGMQGLTPRGALRQRFPSSLGPTTAGHAKNVAALIKDLEQPGKAGGPGRHLHIDAAVEVARKIAAAIEKHGTEPHWFVRDSLPEIGDLLLKKLQRAKGRMSAEGTMVHRGVIKIIDV